MKFGLGVADFQGAHATMLMAQRDLRPDALYVVYPGVRRYPLADGIEAVPLSALLGD